MRHLLRFAPLVAPACGAALLGIAHLVPATGFGLWLRLAAASFVILLPGRLVARCLGQRTVAAAFSWSVALVGGGLALAFALGDSLDAAIAFALAAGAVALVVVVFVRPALPSERVVLRARLARLLVGTAGLVLGGALWAIHGVLSGDSFFHLGRMRKLDALGSLSLHDVSEFAGGGMHPGYAFPLWHGCMAVVARLAGVDPTSVALHEPSLLVPLALVLAFEMGLAVFGSAGLAVAVVLAQVALRVLAQGHGGIYPDLWQPGQAATQLLLPAVVAAFFVLARRPSWPVALTLAAGSADLALVHPTYALFIAIPLIAFVAVRVLLTRGADLRRGIVALVALGLPMGLAYLWLRPVVDQSVALHLGSKGLGQSLHHYRSDLVIHSLTRYNLAPSRVDRLGVVPIAALVLTPLAFFARRRRWSALVLGATVAILALDLWPLVFPHFSNVVSLSQSRRLAVFIPFALALAGGLAVLAAVSRLLALGLALGGGIWLQLAYPGDFGLTAARHQPTLPVWIGLYGAIAALALAAAFAWLPRDPLPRLGRPRGMTAAFAALLFVIPVAVHGFSTWTPSQSVDSHALTPGLIRFLERDVPARSIVFGDLETSYRAVAFAPVYVVAVPPTHAGNTRPNRLFVRRSAVLRFFAHPSLSIPRAWNAGWLVLRRDERRQWQAIERLGRRPVYADDGFVVFRLAT
ncbi:MAG TPA: hypothetical protein VE985_08935 [Gaiellaceae bacterium]|nr:hypothetical protein [Gaiellaceae bacterium]